MATQKMSEIKKKDSGGVLEGQKGEEIFTQCLPQGVSTFQKMLKNVSGLANID